MTQSAIPAAVAAKDPEDIRAAIVGELIPVIPSDVDPLTWDPRELGASGGNTFQAVSWQEKFWWRDETSVAAHDEITVITLLDGVNYLTNDIRVPAAVLSKSISTPPDIADSPPPAFGDAYLVPAASTDEWADHEDEIAIWTARGWRYVIAGHGYLVYVEDELGYYHFTASDVWEAGTGAYNLPDGSVRPSHLLIRDWAVENQTQTTWPATGPAGEQYIVGAGATGLLSGHDLQIAWRASVNAAPSFTTPFVGEEAYDKAQGIDFKWNGTAWASAAGAWVGFSASPLTAGTGGTSNTGSGGGYAYSDTAAPTNLLNKKNDDVTLDHAAKRAGVYLRCRYSAHMTVTGAGGDFTVGLMRATSGVYETNAVDWRQVQIPDPTHDMSVEFLISALDALTHTYKVVFFVGNTGSQSVDTLSRRQFTIEEAA